MEEGRIVSLGQFVVDTFRYLDSRGQSTGEAKPDIIGGGATYFLIGARTFLPSSALGQIIDRDAHSFPAVFTEQLAKYGPDMFEYRDRTDGVAYSRAVNTYQGDVRGFEFLTPFIRLFPDDLAQTRLFQPPPVALHFANRVQHCQMTLDQVDRIAAHGAEISGLGKGWNPDIFWEPFPVSGGGAVLLAVAVPHSTAIVQATCVPENKAAMQALAHRIAVLSPNHVEALSVLGLAPGALDQSAAASGLDADDPLHRGTAREASVRQLVERAAQEMGAWGCRRGVVIRCGGLGACVARQQEEATGSGQTASSARVSLTWIPAYHQPITTATRPRLHPAIIDVTGGGNAFLGGLAAGLRAGLSIERAAVWGSVSASFAIEQDGLPRLSMDEGSGGERWNGVNPMSRVQEIEERLGWLAGQ